MLRRMQFLSLAAAIMLASAGVAFAATPQDRVAPTTPGNFQVTATTSYTVSLAWRASTDNSGTVRYVLSSSLGSVTLPAGTTSYTWRSGLLAGYGYTFTIYAIDPSGNASRSISAHTVLPADRTPPTAPTLNRAGTGPTSVSLSWTPATDDGPTVTYELVGAGRAINVGSVTAYTVTGLTPGATYTFTVRARDIAQNASASSNAVTVTTPLSNPPDTTPPSTPAGFSDRGMVFPDGETWLFWERSTDDISPQALITYRVVVNGVLDHTVTGSASTILYVPTGRSSTIELIAVDEAGNASPPASLVVTP